jgi:voltage-gated potassium channel
VQNESLRPTATAAAAAVERAGFWKDLLATPRLVFERVGPPLVALVLLFVGGAVGYGVLGVVYGREWGALECLWMSVISLTTVGYGEVFPLDFPAARIYTMALLVIGMGVTVWAMSSVTAFFVEGHLGLFFREKALEKHIDALRGHTIVAGLTTTSEHVLDEHEHAGRPVVVVDPRHEVAHPLRDRRPNLPVVVGDPSAEAVLARAGIDRAHSLVCCLPSDRDNLFLVVTARQLRPGLEIVVECGDEQSVPKFRAAGANHVINPVMIGGMRIASQVLRPQAVAFLDTMLRAPGDARVSECVVAAGAPVAGQTLAQARIPEQSGLVVVAVRPAGAQAFSYSPPPETRLDPGAVVIVVGERARVARVEALTGPAARA